MEYKVYNIFETEQFNKITRGLKIAQCMGSNSIGDMLANSAESQKICKPEDISISETLFCSFCNEKFEDRAQQRLHYKLDRHRYNLKQKLSGLKSVTEEKFAQLADDLSSISGSESDSEEEGDSSDFVPSSAAKLGSYKSNELMQVRGCEDDATGSLPGNKQDDSGAEKRHEHLRLMAARHAKIFFENEDGKILSMYRCLLHGKKDELEKDEQLIALALKAVANPLWAVIMLGGGHFAASIFEGQEVLVHKTFHCYTVRSSQGGTQSSRDGRSGGSHPKSAGASLRRYNEAALIQHVQDIMQSWSSYLGACGLILYHAVGHNRNVLFGGKNPPLNKSDCRLRTIPFATRRATFSEVKRVHTILTSVEMYGPGEAFQTAFPQSPRKRGSKTQAAIYEKSMSGKTADSTNQDQDKKIDGMNTESKQHLLPGTNSEITVERNEDTSPKRGRTKCNIDRAKPRKSPHRPLPGIVTAVLTRSSSESDVSESLGKQMIEENIEISFENLQEFYDTVPQEMKDKKRSKDNSKCGRKQQKKKAEKDLYSASVMALRRKLWAACRLGDTDLLINSLQTVQPIEEEPENCETETVKINDNSEASKYANRNTSISKVEYLSCLNENVGENKETLLHVAAQGGHMDIIRALMEAGCDPCVKNKKLQTPYVVSANKETRNIFRRFLADFPDKFDYSKSQIGGPLTDDMEQKMVEKRREQRKVKREREKERKKEEEEKREEEAEKERFLQLSDREKRALAAERRFLSQIADVIIQ
ncbi:ankyrin repeat and zinc finger domain-containing protein 1-like isoform X2 [Zootermopsis nevadensis]|uniref:ankyrin repeat and zinc finger domain-containing protein 1-like isoform X2 n=1 Tax=Zootermopsis nevadensis TaxID=136037 RepID=UPI000B8E48CE|nr:ankyrin repeat and zinc finger domain-containing protein 1-like isoform X2 [Zootermopsis nevadensis]